VAVYQTISDTGFIVGRFDPHNEMDEVVDGQIGTLVLSKSGAGDFWSAFGTKINESQGWTGDKKNKGGHAVADYRKKRMEKIALAQARKETRMPASLRASSMLPKSAAGKVALGTIPVALAIRYNQQASDAAQSAKAAVTGGYKKTRDTRHYRPASAYYEDHLGKSSDYTSETIAIIDAWISKAGFTAPPGFTGGAPAGSTTGPAPQPKKSKRQRYQEATPSEKRKMGKPWSMRAQETGQRISRRGPTQTADWLLGPKAAKEHTVGMGADARVIPAGARTGGAIPKLGAHIGAHPGVYAPMAFGAGSAGIAGLAARRQAKAAKKAAAIEAVARKQRNAKLALAGAASLPLLALAANKKPVEKSDYELEKGIIGAARDARFIRRANRLGGNIPPQMMFSEKVAANRASRRAAGAEHKARRHKFGQNIPTGAPAPNAPPAQPQGFWGKLNQGINTAGETASNAAQHVGNVRGALGMAPAAAARPATRMGLTTGQQIAIGGAGAAGLYGGYKLRQPKPQPYQ
jgi:hypothetical protein